MKRECFIEPPRRRSGGSAAVLSDQYLGSISRIVVSSQTQRLNPDRRSGPARSTSLMCSYRVPYFVTSTSRHTRPKPGSQKLRVLALLRDAAFGISCMTPSANQTAEYRAGRRLPSAFRPRGSLGPNLDQRDTMSRRDKTLARRAMDELWTKGILPPRSAYSDNCVSRSG